MVEAQGEAVLFVKASLKPALIYKHCIANLFILSLFISASLKSGKSSERGYRQENKIWRNHRNQTDHQKATVSAGVGSVCAV